VTASIFARLREHLARFPGDVIPFHIGDTHLPPAVALDALDWREPPQAELYAYGAPPGWAPLVDAIAAKLRRKNAIEAGAGAIQITAGATHALACAVQALCDPGDELILVTPHWPLIRGIAIAGHATPVEAPLDAIEAAITPRTAGIYVATPNNPDGAMLSTADIARIVELARARRLWIFSDEVYEDYVYDGAHVSIAPHAPERTVTVFSCSKGYAQAGLRVGYVVAPPAVIDGVRKLANHSVFNVPVAMQRAARAAIVGGEPFLAAARERYRAARDRARARLRAPAAVPAGAAYLWVDFGAWSGGGDCMPVLERIAAAGVLVAPGSAFGDACGRFARLCFTGVPEARLDEGIDRINGVL
jgi:aspartate/methionine/tyrosine aminotransferase